MAKKRILIAEPSRIGKLPPQRGEEAVKMMVDGGGGLTDNMSNQYIRLHQEASPPQPPQTHNPIA